MIIDKKCTCGSKSTGDTTIRCCNLCGLPLPNEPWHFNLDENIFSQVEKLVINSLPDLLKECHALIQLGIYTDDGIDGGDGQKLLDKIEQALYDLTAEKIRSHRDA